MTEQELTEIEQRADAADVPALVAEVRRLREAVRVRDRRRFNEHAECHFCGCDRHKRCIPPCPTVTHPEVRRE